jgi:hypothetical protein
MNTTETLREISALISNEMAAHVAVCEYSAEDNTPTLHIDLWRGLALCDLPEQVAALTVASEGHWDGGRSYSLQLPFPVGCRVLVDEDGFTYSGKVLTVDGNLREISFSNGDEGWASVADCQLADSN